MTMNSFISTGADESLLKSLQGKDGIDQEVLEKAIDKAKLVQKEVQVRGKNGKIYTRKQWVRPDGSEPQTSEQGSKEQPQKNPNAGSKVKSRVSKIIDDMYGGELKLSSVNSFSKYGDKDISGFTISVSGEGGMNATSGAVFPRKDGKYDVYTDGYLDEGDEFDEDAVVTCSSLEDAMEYAVESFESY